MRVIGLAVALFAFWLLLSGHYTAWLIGAGAVTAVAIALLGIRFGFIDEEGFPLERLLAGLLYWPWLLIQIVKATLQVTRVILDPRLPIEPRLVRTKYTPRTPAGIATYANSITLTPGTITVEVDHADNEFVVHALTADGVAGLMDGEMDRRVARFEGKH